MSQHNGLFFHDVAAASGFLYSLLPVWVIIAIPVILFRNHSTIMPKRLCHYLLLFSLMASVAGGRSVFASGVAGVESDTDWMNLLAGVLIVLVLAGVVWLSRYVKKQRENHVQVMIRMYCSILDGRLRNLIINLQDSVELICSDNYENELLSVSQDSFWRLGDKRLRADLLELAEKSSLDGLAIQDMNYAFECLEEAVAYMKKLSGERDGRVEMLARFERKRIEDLLLGAIHALESVKRRVYP